MEKLELLRNRLSKKRFVHSMNVADESYRLSFIYGENPDKAYLAGLLHDICKELPPEEQREMVMKSGLSVTREELLSPPLWHAIAGAVAPSRRAHFLRAWRVSDREGHPQKGYF